MSTRRIRASIDRMSDPYTFIDKNRNDIIKKWMRTYDGEPNTSWNRIFENAFNEFIDYYSQSEESGFLLERFLDGSISEYGMKKEFDIWIADIDLSEFDY